MGNPVSLVDAAKWLWEKSPWLGVAVIYFAAMYFFIESGVTLVHERIGVPCVKADSKVAGAGAVIAQFSVSLLVFPALQVICACAIFRAFRRWMRRWEIAGLKTAVSVAAGDLSTFAVSLFRLNVAPGSERRLDMATASHRVEKAALAACATYVARGDAANSSHLIIRALAEANGALARCGGGTALTELFENLVDKVEDLREVLLGRAD